MRVSEIRVKRICVNQGLGIYTKSCFCIIWTPIVAQNTESLHKLWMVHSRMLVQYNNREMVLRWFLYLPSSFTLYSRAGGSFKNPKGASGHNQSRYLPHINWDRSYSGATGAAGVPKPGKAPIMAARRRCLPRLLFFKIKVRPWPCRPYRVRRFWFMYQPLLKFNKMEKYRISLNKVRGH